VEYLTKETFKEKVFDFEANEDWKFEGDKPAIIDFFAEWCMPCKQIAPILEELSDEHPEIDIYKINTEQEQELAATFGIRSIPSILFIPKEGKPQMAAGALPKESFEDMIENILK